MAGCSAQKPENLIFWGCPLMFRECHFFGRLGRNSGFAEFLDLPFFWGNLGNTIFLVTPNESGIFPNSSDALKTGPKVGYSPWRGPSLLADRAFCPHIFDPQKGVSGKRPHRDLGTCPNLWRSLFSGLHFYPLASGFAPVGAGPRGGRVVVGFARGLLFALSRSARPRFWRARAFFGVRTPETHFFLSSDKNGEQRDIFIPLRLDPCRSLIAKKAYETPLGGE